MINRRDGKAKIFTRSSKNINAATAKSYDELYRASKDYMPIYHRAYLNMEKVRIVLAYRRTIGKRMSEYADPEFAALVAQYGRYILIASSRPGGQPANLKVYGAINEARV
jgi:alpha-L-fucosidase 2